MLRGFQGEIYVKNLFLSACAAICIAGHSSAATFDLDVTYLPAGQEIDFDGNLTTATTQAFSARQVQLIDAAASFWESVVTGFDGFSGAVDPVLSLTAAFAPIDGLNRTLAFGGLTNAETVGTNPATGSGFLRATEGILQFDTADYGPRSEQNFLDTAVHEIAHAMGFGLIFDVNGLLETPTRFNGAQAVAKFNELNGTTITSILLDDSGGHWNECYERGVTDPLCSDAPPSPNFFNDAELLTPFTAFGAATLSPVSVAALRDMGYQTTDLASYALPVASNIPALPVPLPAGAWLLVGGLAGLGAMRRRSTSQA